MITGKKEGWAGQVHASAAEVKNNPSHYGQLLFQPHLHLSKTVRPNELPPGIPSEGYARHWKELMVGLPSNSVVILMAARVTYMIGRLHQVCADTLPNIVAASYKGRQGADLQYLPGFEEPDSAVVLGMELTFFIRLGLTSYQRRMHLRVYRLTLFSNGKDSAKEKWDGPRTGFDADDALTIKAFPAQLRSMISLNSNVYIDLPQSPHNNGRSTITSETVVESLSSSQRKPLAHLIAQLRVFKSVCEQQTMHFTRSGISESALAAHLEYLCSRLDSQLPAYVPIVESLAGQMHSLYTTLTNQVVQDGEMILMDAGCNYNSHIRSQRFLTASQKELYSVVLSAQKALEGLCTEAEGLSIHDLHRKSCDLLRQELKQITGDLERVLYPHFLSHPFGIGMNFLDLHESSCSDTGGPLKAGMVTTFRKHFHDIGIRIEDEVLVGEKHPVALSVSAPKEIAGVEGACQ
ncbi:peptidase M24 [Suillus placidus]|uniref:Peptidase M24 n=1 Tax=Suillus placidus TaxID=48579 RepID=A0A9P6ZTY7_9AGAM|nr:peptidase M24 [Suillus placidus]